MGDETTGDRWTLWGFASIEDMARVIVDLKARVEELGALAGKLQSDRYEGVDRQGMLDRIVALERVAEEHDDRLQEQAGLLGAHVSDHYEDNAHRATDGG